MNRQTPPDQAGHTELQNVALKEWAAVCRALEDGRQTLLLRKGGIHESAGQFEVEHRRFLLFPTYVHQNLVSLKESEHGGFEPHSTEPQFVTLRLVGDVTDIVRVQDRSRMKDLDGEHVWTDSLIDTRFNYRPENPLYLLLVRVSRLARPTTIANDAAYAGCRSWVPLDERIDTAGAVPVLDDDAYARRRTHILRIMGA